METENDVHGERVDPIKELHERLNLISNEFKNQLEINQDLLQIPPQNEEKRKVRHIQDSFIAFGVREQRYRNVQVEKERLEQITIDEVREGEAAYIHEDGLVFNKHFQKVDFRAKLQPPPEPELFSTFEDYEQGMLKWAQDSSNAVETVQLPRIMGRHYYRPYFKKIEDNIKSKESQSIVSSLLDEGQPQNIETVKYPSLEHLYNGPLNPRWDANLIPIEPKPEFFDSYEEYEESILRWGKYCLSQQCIPPHPSQLQELLGLQIKENETFFTPHKFSRNELLNADDEPQPASQSHVKTTVREPILKNLWSTLSSDTQKSIRKAFSEVLKERMKSKERTGHFFVSHTPFVQGYLDSDSEIQARKMLSNANITFGEQSIPNSLETWLNSKVLTSKWCHFEFPPQDAKRGGKKKVPKSPFSFQDNVTSSIYDAIQSNLDHQTMLLPQKKTIENYIYEHAHDTDRERRLDTNLPDFDLGKIRLKLIHNPTYQKALRNTLLQLENNTNYFQYFSWAHPNIPSIILEMQIEQLMAIFDDVDQNDKAISTGIIEMLFSVECHVDTFISWLSSTLSKDVTYKEFILERLSHQNISELLQIFDNNSSKLILAKLSVFISEILLTPSGKDYLSQYIKMKQHHFLINIVKAVSYFDEIPVKMFEYTDNLRYSIVEKFGIEFNTFVVDLVVLHYMVQIYIRLDQDNENHAMIQEMLFVSINEFIGSCTSTLSQHLEILDEKIWQLFQAQSRHISNLGLFLLKQIVELEFHPDIQPLLSQVPLFDRFRELVPLELKQKLPSFMKGVVANLTITRTSHVQNTIREIFKMFTASNTWKKTIFKYYSCTENVIQDVIFMSHYRKVEEYPALLTRIILPYVLHQFDIQPYRPPRRHSLYIQYLEEDLFTQIIREIKSKILQENNTSLITQGCVSGAKLLKYFVLYAICLGDVTSVQAEQKVSKTNKNMFKGFFKKKKSTTNLPNKKSSSPLKLKVDPSLIQELIDIICDDHVAYHAVSMRMDLLDSLRYLVKSDDVFAHVPKDFDQVIYELCASPSFPMNQNAWRLFYQSCKYHPKFLQKIVASGFITKFLDLLKNDDFIISNNALSYFTKLLLLQTSATKIPRELHQSPNYHLKLGLNQCQANAQEQEKAYQQLVTFLSENPDSFHQHLSFLFKKTQNREQRTFQSLCRLFEVIYCHSETQSLLASMKEKIEREVEALVCMIYSNH